MMLQGRTDITILNWKNRTTPGRSHTHTPAPPTRTYQHTHSPILYTMHRPVASQPGGGGSELGWVEHQAHTPLGHCPRDVINLKNAPTLGHSQAPPLGHCPRDVIRPPKNWKTPPSWTFTSTPPLDIARVTSSTYSKGGTKLLKGGKNC